MKNDGELKSLINLKNLEALQRDEGFDTRAILDSLESVETLCANWFGDGGYKDQIRRLAELADEIVNADDFSSLENEDERIYDLAAEITDELFEPLEGMEKLYRTISKLEELYPDDEDFDADDED